MLLDRVDGRIERLELRAELQVKLLQTGQRFVDHHDLRLQPHGHARGVGADHAAAQNDHLGRRNAGHPAQQNAAPALRLLQAMGAGLHRHAARDLAHRRQQRQAAAGVGHRLIGDGDGAGLQKQLRLFGIGGEVKVGEQDLAPAQHRAFLRLGFLHLHHHIRTGEDGCGVRRDLRPGGFVLPILQPDGGAGSRLHKHPVPVMSQFADRGRGQPDAVFVVFDFRWHTDEHGHPPRVGPVPESGAQRTGLLVVYSRIWGVLGRSASLLWGCRRIPYAK